MIERHERQGDQAVPTLRIGIDIRPAQRESRDRGIGRYIFDLVDGLTQTAPGHEYVLLTLPGEPLPERFANLAEIRRAACRFVPVPTEQLGHLPHLGKRITWQKLPPVWEARCRRNEAANGRSLAEAARREGLDILHLTSLFEPTFFTAAAYPCPVVKTFYDATPLAMREAFLDRWPYQLRVVYRRQADTLTAGRADAFVAISESAKRDAVDLMNVPAERVHVIYPTIPPGFETPPEPAALRACRERIGLGEGRRFFLFCSGGGPNKNRDGTVRAFARFAKRQPKGAEYALVLAGPTGGDEATLREIARTEGLAADQLILTGFVSDADLVALFHDAVALLSPSFYEGFGLPAAQALQAGLPVIASRTSSLPEVVGEAGILIAPADLDEIAAAMGRLASDEKLWATFSARGVEQAKLFTAERQADAHLRLYARLTAASPSSLAEERVGSASSASVAA